MNSLKTIALVISIVINILLASVIYETRDMSTLTLRGKNGETLELGDLSLSSMGKGEGRFGLQLLDPQGNPRCVSSIHYEETSVFIFGEDYSEVCTVTNNKVGTRINASSPDGQHSVTIDLTDNNGIEVIKRQSTKWKASETE